MQARRATQGESSNRFPIYRACLVSIPPQDGAKASGPSDSSRYPSSRWGGTSDVSRPATDQQQPPLRRQTTTAPNPPALAPASGQLATEQGRLMLVSPVAHLAPTNPSSACVEKQHHAPERPKMEDLERDVAARIIQAHWRAWSAWRSKVGIMGWGCEHHGMGVRASFLLH